MHLALVFLAAGLMVVPARRAADRLPTATHRAPDSLRLPAPLLIGLAAGASGILLVGPFLGLAALGVGWVVASRILQALQQRSESAELIALSRALDVMTAELEAGHSPAGALHRAAEDATGPLAEPLTAIVSRLRVGATCAHALAADPRFHLISQLTQIADTHGLPLGGLLDTARASVEQRRIATAEIRALLAGPQATAVILAALPAAGVLLGQGLGANPLDVLLGDGLGQWLLLIGVGLICAGIAWSDRITAQAVT